MPLLEILGFVLAPIISVVIRSAGMIRKTVILNLSVFFCRLSKKFYVSFPVIIGIVVFFMFMPVLFGGDRIQVSATKTEEQLRSQIEGLKKKIESTKKQAEGLAKEINIINNDIELKTIQIRQSEYQIVQKKKELERLRKDIELMEVRLDRLDEKIEYHQKLLAERLRQHYINNQRSSFEILVSSEGLGDFMARLEYLQRIEIQDRQLIGRMGDTKDKYEEQQDLLKDKKRQVEEIKKEIEEQKARAEQLKGALEQQRKDKDHLLKVTKNNEQRYKKMLKDAERELKQIQSAANVVIREGKGVKVKRGEIIGTMGNTGYSTGAHLHFGIYKYTVKDFQEQSNWGWYYRNYRNPIDYLEAKTVVWGTGCYRDASGSKKTGKGKWKWPMSSPKITQNYGSKTCYNWMYGGKPHPALDMVGIGDISIRSIADGEAYFCRNCLKDGANGVFIFHDDGLMSVYWHLK